MKNIEPIYKDLKGYITAKLSPEEWNYIKRSLLQARLEGQIAGMLEVMDNKSK